MTRAIHRSLSKLYLCLLTNGLCLLTTGWLQDVSAQDARTSSEVQANADWSGFSVKQSANWLRLTPKSKLEQNECTIPRLFNPLRKALIRFGDEIFPVQVSPEIERWTLSWKDVKHQADGAPISIELDLGGEFRDQPEVLKSGTDGSFSLPAHAALTRSRQPDSMKLRYEPQPFKNTIGYWVSPHDFAQWNIDLEKPGIFNVEILQGCGAGQGGSRMQVSIEPESGLSASTIDFVVEETGHFQDFRWRHLGTVELNHADTYQMTVKVLELAHQAAMDIRAMQLIRIPSKSK